MNSLILLTILELSPIVEDYIPGIICDTSFKYPLTNNESKQTVVKGIKNFKKTIPYVLALIQNS